MLNRFKESKRRGRQMDGIKKIIARLAPDYYQIQVKMGIDRWKRMTAGSQRKEKMEANTLFELQLKKRTTI